ncbi:TPA: DNA polymerase I [Candidatus Dependentiae bacterium]|nr:MAG: polymerase I protein [candidate division TM6 bacterium GW2011_GWF2_36_131]KKQ03828.1 MAG: polymerase I protein [candidate division TM6 bacterium GW2011_GWE2_36_25]KKQ19974.1 MAG: polymerase I protein [candidate division TM6 bacterium GW2011_GWA2_36_9]HBR70596.1 DNA polymerase I [Candidatus Dependentiae bacterium]HCU00689.1 DNA polymerase I [Candidatus Dependentiae bacterium]
MKKKLFLIDGSSFLYRAYYSMKPLHAPNGQPVQAVYGFCRMIKKLVNTFKPEHMVLVWDSKGKTLRHELYQDYKATRQAPPSDLFEQKKHITKFADLIDLVQLEQPGVEADDSIYSLAKDFSKKDYDIVIVTSDKDLSQLLDESIAIYDSFKDEMITAKSFEEKRGFSVSQVPFYHALLGDSSDNIPGVRGIGKKGAEELVNQFESLDDLYANLDKVSKERTRIALEAGREKAFLSLKLFQLRYTSPQLSINDIQFDEKNWWKARPLFEELNFKTLLKEIDGEFGTGNTSSGSSNESLSQTKKYKFVAVQDVDELKRMVSFVREKGFCALDTETDCLDPLQSTLVGLSFCCEEGIAWYIPVAHQTSEAQLSHDDIYAVIKPLLEDDTIKKVLHNAKFDQLVLLHAGIKVCGVIFDTMVAASLVVKEGQRIGLKALSEGYFNEHMLTFDEMVKSKKLENFAHVSIVDAVEYAAADAHQTFKLWHVLSQELKEKNLEKLYDQIEHPLIDVLFAMECEGIYCDIDLLRNLDQQVSKVLGMLEQEIYALTGTMPGTLNLNSPKQLEQLLFYQLNLPPQKKSAKRTGYSTDHEVLEALAELHIVPQLILKHRELYKLKSTYIVALPEAINPFTKKIHTSFSQTNVATGRLASSEPNLQNIPVQVGDVTVRAAFYAPEGHTFISADYSQIELRVLAQLSQDEALKDAFLTNGDIHTQTAAKIFEVAPENVTTQQRQIGKRINFSIMYGKTPYGLSKELKISQADAKKYIEKYFEQYPGVKNWMDTVIEQTVKTGYTQTLYGRRRHVPGIYEKNKNLFDAARRIAINTPAQGTAAEIMKLGMINLKNAFAHLDTEAKIILQIHDELLVQVPEKDSALVSEIIKSTLEHVVDWDIPLAVTIREGKNWQEVTK